MMKSILSFTLAEFKNSLTSLGIKSFVATQVFDWVYQKYATSFDQMLNISKANRAILAQHYTIQSFKDIQTVSDDEDLAIKLILKTHDDKSVEAVVLFHEKYTSLCISSQCGCPLNCQFCLTGQVGFKRNLESYEIIEQVLIAKSLGHDVSRLIFMGMGEPFLNYDAVMSAIDHINSEDGFNIGRRRITVSTVGLIKPLKRLIQEQRFYNLAFSVGNANPIRRLRVMPNEKLNPITDIVALLKEYQSLHNRQLTLEYTLLKDENDSEEDLSHLVKLAKYLDAKVNLINLNPHSLIPYEPVAGIEVKRAKEFLISCGVRCTVRFRKGARITAACGQLGASCL